MLGPGSKKWSNYEIKKEPADCAAAFAFDSGCQIYILIWKQCFTVINGTHFPMHSMFD